MRALRNPLLIIVVVSAVIGVSTLTRGHEWGDDFASYIMQGQSILNGNVAEFVERNTFTIFKSSFQIGPVAYPWGYPLILTPALLIKGVHPLTLKLPGLFFFAGFLICLYLITKNRLTQTKSLLLVALFAFNPTLIKFLDYILSDIPFLFFVFLGLLFIADFNPKQRAGKYIVAGAIIFFAFFIRTTGIILLASYLAYQAIRFYREREERRFIFINSVLTAGSFGLLWLVSSLVFPDGQGSYLEQLKGLTPAIFKDNIRLYFFLLGTFFGDNPVWIYVYYALVVFFVIGALTRRESDQHLLIFFALYLVAMIFWPERQGMRFIFPLLPIFVYFAFHGMDVVINRLPEKSRPYGTGIIFVSWLAIIGIFVFNSSAGAYANLKDNRKINGPFDPYSSDVYNYIRAETPPDSVIVFYKPRAMRLFTDRDTLMSAECEKLPLGDYVVISKKAENSQIPPDQIDECGLPLKSVFENQRFIIYQLPN